MFKFVLVFLTLHSSGSMFGFSKGTQGSGSYNFEVRPMFGLILCKLIIFEVRAFWDVRKFDVGISISASFPCSKLRMFGSIPCSVYSY